MGAPAKKLVTEAAPTNADYRAQLAKLQDIPTLPLVAVRINELIQDPTSSAADIAAVLKRDQVLTAKVLRLVNSGYYSIPGGVTDVQRALAFLGFNTLSQIVLGISVMSVFSGLEPAQDEFDMAGFWKHALATGVAAEVIAKRKKFARPDEAFTCGLLHDIGKLVMHVIDPGRLTEIARQARTRAVAFTEVERERDLPGHSFLGEAIAAHWGLPQTIRLAIRYHHQNVAPLATVLTAAKPVLHAVRLANTICVKNRYGHSGDCSRGDITPDMLSNLGLREADLPEIEQQLSIGMEKAGAFFSATR